MSAVQLNQFAASMRHYYDLHGGLARIGNKSWRSTGCCFATPTGRLWTGKSATDGSFVFPSQPVCRPATAATALAFEGGPRLSVRDMGNERQ